MVELPGHDNAAFPPSLNSEFTSPALTMEALLPVPVGQKYPAYIRKNILKMDAIKQKGTRQTCSSGGTCRARELLGGRGTVVAGEAGRL